MFILKLKISHDLGHTENNLVYVRIYVSLNFEIMYVTTLFKLS